MQLLIVDNDKQHVQRLKRLLQEHAFVVYTASDGEKGSYLARVNDYNCVLISDHLPLRRGLQVCVEIRGTGSSVPVIAFTEKPGAEPVVALLNAGADDCLRKPFDGSELLARIRAILRRGPNVQTEVYRAGDIVLNSKSQRVFRGSKHIPLSKREFSLLEVLFKNRGAILSRSVILEQVWGYDLDASTTTIESHIYSLRKKLGKRAKYLIQNVPGRGYFLDT